MMRAGSVAVIPWDRLIDALKGEARRSAERNSQKDRFVNQLGPIDGFLMTYGLKSQSGMMTNGTSARLGRTIELEKFELDPTGDVVIESVAETLGTAGRLRLELATCKAQHTTVTVWVYPDSFNEFRGLKERLFAEGFLSQPGHCRSTSESVHRPAVLLAPLNKFDLQCLLLPNRLAQLN